MARGEDGNTQWERLEASLRRWKGIVLVILTAIDEIDLLLYLFLGLLQND